MLLAIDVGNTNIVLGGIREDTIVFEERLATRRDRSAVEYALEIRKLLELRGVGITEIGGSVISSVVPPVLYELREAVALLTGREPLVVGPGLETGLELCVDAPERLGADRIVAAAAALAEHVAPLLVIDMGTATTVEIVEPPNRYIGGLIIPGVRVSLEALSGRTAQLPAIALQAPERIVCRNTVDCMRSGSLYGAAAMLDGLIDRIGEELGHASACVATGGLARLVLPLCRHKIALKEDLLLRGLNVIYQANRQS